MNRELSLLLARQRLNDSQTASDLQQLLHTAAQHCRDTQQEHIHTWQTTGTRLVFSPVFENEQLSAIQCFAQENQNAQLHELQETLDKLPLGVWVTNRSGEFCWLNQAMPYSAQDDSQHCPSLNWIKHIHPDDMATYAASFASAGHQGQVAYDFRMRMPNGSMRTLHVEGTRIAHADGRTKRWVGTVQDVQAHKDVQLLLQNELVQLQAQAVSDTQQMHHMQAKVERIQQMEVLGELTGSVTHDLNNLLFIIHLNASKIQRVCDDADKVHEYASLIQKDVVRATQTASALMRLSGPSQQLPQTHATAHLLQGLEVLLRQAVGAEAQFRLTLAKELWPIHVEKTFFENCLLNLTINARDALKNGTGLVHIQVSNTQAVQDDLVRHFVQIDVIDNGSGMSAEEQARIFTPFYTTKPLGKGTGLGLSVVASFVKAADGIMRTHSALGLGTTMSLLLPASPHPLGSRDAAPQPLQAGTGQVLIVEDDLPLRNAMTRLLTDMGYTITSAYTHDIAVQYIKNGLRPDLILADLKTPGKLTALSMVKELEAIGLLPRMLFMTGYPRTPEVLHGLLDARFPVLQKPIEESELTLRVRAMLQAAEEA